ncbi:sulfite exporter TauE/SafE family protein [Altererythrobacter sp. ZODW24]|uniref:sulfite exporter TauE/SafE family protein n=1 Tax=Altererythrobacter sp. ZODW24 TaxID=2185142 RepID=UPI001F08811E|nr:sulfite exporter TauE/SafE family protein [Altererythrobacter sp. ZODW24]
MVLFGINITELLPFIAVGFAAQLVDGAMGMAFGVISNTFLVSMIGIPPAQASHRVHVIKIFTTAASGTSHLLGGNVDGRLFLRLVLTGIVGGIAGTFFLTAINPRIIAPVVLTYLTLIGLSLLIRGLRDTMPRGQARFVGSVGILGGFLDAVGGGGWGPVVTPNLIIQGAEPRRVVGTVNAAEFFLTIAISAAFVLQIGLTDLLGPSLGLLIGGVIAAPFGAWVAKRAPARIMLILVGTVLTATSLYGLWLVVS